MGEGKGGETCAGLNGPFGMVTTTALMLMMAMVMLMGMPIIMMTVMVMVMAMLMLMWARPHVIRTHATWYARPRNMLRRTEALNSCERARSDTPQAASFLRSVKCLAFNMLNSVSKDLETLSTSEARSSTKSQDTTRPSGFEISAP